VAHVTTSARRRSTGSPTGLARKDRIMKAAAKVFAERGFSNATVRDIADEADMLSGSLYYYFQSKEEIVEEVLADYLDLMLRNYTEALDGAESPGSALKQLIAVALRGVVDKSDHVKILQNDYHYVGVMARIQERERKVERIWLNTIDSAMASGEIRDDFDARMIFRTFMGAVLAVIRWFDPKGRVKIDQIITIQTSILFDGVKAASAAPARSRG
jgi:AcrR family transcriptional regulator